MHNLRDVIGRIAKGDVITADWLNRVMDAATRENLPPGGLEDGAGALARRAVETVQWRLARTVSNPEDAPYPKPEDRPDTYWCEFLSPELSAVPTQQGYRAPTLIATAEPLELVHWLGNRYVPEGTVLRAWRIAPGREATLANYPTDLWVAFDQQQVATFIVFELVDPLNKTDATVKAKFLEYWDGQRPWDPDDNPEAEFNLVNTGLIFPWEWNLSQYPAGTKGIAALDPESGIANPISYRILFMAHDIGDNSSNGGSNGGEPVQKCILLCGSIDSEGCYNVTEAVATFPAGTTFQEGATRRLMMCAGSDQIPDIPDNSGFGSSQPDCASCLRVSGSGTPPGAAGDYEPLATLVNGQCVWRKWGTSWKLAYGGSRWFLFDQDSDPKLWWWKFGPDVVGVYGPGPNVEGTMTVATC